MPISTSAKGLLTVGLLTGFVAAAAGAETAATRDAAPPDFSGLAGWQAIGPDYQPVPGAPGPVASDPAHPYFSNAAARRAGGQPTFRVADLTNSNLKPWAKAVMKRENDKVLGGGIGYTARSSCMPAGVPAFMLFPVVEPLYVLQTPKQVTMVFSGDAQVRRIYLDVPHTARPNPSWYGESVGHYEGDTLVIDTIGLNDKTYLDNYRTPHSEKLHIVERWKLLDPMTIQVAFTVDDPDTFNEPWTASYGFRRIERPMPYEEVCAENNQHLFDYHVPTAAKADF